MNSQELLEELKKLDFTALVDMYFEAKTGVHHPLIECPLKIISKVKDIEDFLKRVMNVDVEDNVKSFEDMCQKVEDSIELYKKIDYKDYKVPIQQLEVVGNDHIRKLKDLMDTKYKDNEERKKQIMDYIKRVEMAMKKARTWERS
jgi:flagellar motor component MotA